MDGVADSCEGSETILMRCFRSRLFQFGLNRLKVRLAYLREFLVIFGLVLDRLLLI